MEYLSIKEQKIERIKEIFQPLLGQKIVGYNVVELFDEDYDSWDFWHELPLRLHVGNERLSISWEKFDDLALVQSDDIDEHWNDATMRWCSKGIDALDEAINQNITGLAMATYPESQFWSRLLIYLDNETVLDIYNALDENAYALYQKNGIEGNVIDILS